MRVVKLTDEGWLRGEGSGRSKLLRKYDNKQCCVGIYLEACGVPREVLKAHRAAKGVWWQMGCSFPEEAQWLVDRPATTSALYMENDCQVTDNDEDRVEILNNILAQGNVPVKFEFVAGDAS